jgi:chromosome segregation ATPase
MNNKTVKKQHTSPRPANRGRFHASNSLQAAALIGNPLHSIFTSGNRSQSRNNRLLTNVTQIKDDCKRLHEKLQQMKLASDAQCEELQEKLKQIDGKELDRLRVLLKKCNKEKEEKDKIIKKLNKDLEVCKREKEEKDETISRHESIIARYQTFYKKFNE